MHVSMSTHAALVRTSKDFETPMSVFLGCSLRQEAGSHEKLSGIPGFWPFSKKPGVSKALSEHGHSPSVSQLVWYVQQAHSHCNPKLLAAGGTGNKCQGVSVTRLHF